MHYCWYQAHSIYETNKASWRQRILYNNVQYETLTMLQAEYKYKMKSTE